MASSYACTSYNNFIPTRGFPFYPTSFCLQLFCRKSDDELCSVLDCKVKRDTQANMLVTGRVNLAIMGLDMSFSWMFDSDRREVFESTLINS